MQVDTKNARAMFDLNSHKAENLYNNIVKIDYSQGWSCDLGSFDCEQTFSWLDWILAENIKNRSGFPFNALVPEEQYRLIFNIFHHGSTLL